MRVLLHETISGEMVTEITFSDAEPSSAICDADRGTVTIPAYSVNVPELLPMLVPRKMSLSISSDEGVCYAAGPISLPEMDSDDDGSHQLVIPFQGIESLFERRVVLPYPYGNLVDSQGYPDPRWDTSIRNVEYGTMMKKLYQQALKHPGGSLPVNFEADRSGSRERNWVAVDGKRVQDSIVEISELLNGVEWDWVPNVDFNDKLSYTLVTGTDADTEITSDFWHTWSLGGAAPDIRKWAGKISPEFMTSSVFFTGGKDDDRVMVSHRYNGTLIDAGFPLSEEWDSSHSSVSIQGTLDGWAEGRLAEGQSPVHYWSFEVRASSAPGLRHGDWCTIEALDHWAIPDGSYPRRIVSVARKASSDWITVTVAGVQTW